ncbi:MAG TPA: hypothetical protein VIM14_16725 [Polyangia bacterium]|jgi:hypothetical protein
MTTILAMTIPGAVVLITLFGLLARGNPKPGGVALFWRVGLVGLGLGFAVWYLTAKSGLLPSLPAAVGDANTGLLVGAAAIVVIAALGSALKRQR